MAKKESCPKCSSEDFVKAEDSSNKRYCNKCKHVWVPGFSDLKRTDLLLKHAQEENVRLKAEVTKLRKQLALFEQADFDAIAEEFSD